MRHHSGTERTRGSSRLRPLVVALLCLAAGCGRDVAAAGPPKLSSVERVFGAEPNARVPLVIALHGLGDSPEGILELFHGFAGPARVVAPRAPDAHVVGTSWYPIDDRKRAAGVALERAALLARWIEHVRAARPTKGRPIVTGFSQGGVLSFSLAAYHPERLAAAIPLAGLLPDPTKAVRKAPNLRVTALHGEADARIPYALGVAAVEQLARAGTPATMIPYPGVGHTLSDAMVARFQQLLGQEVARAARATTEAP